jgi:hypothetical protein
VRQIPERGARKESLRLTCYHYAKQPAPHCAGRAETAGDGGGKMGGRWGGGGWGTWRKRGGDVAAAAAAACCGVSACEEAVTDAQS